LLLRYAGLGLIVYAVIPATDMLHAIADSDTADILIRIQYPLVLLPATFWSIAMLFLLPDSSEWREKLSERTIMTILLIDIAIITIAATTNLVFDFSADDPEAGLLFIAFALFVVLTLGGLLILTLRAYQAEAGEFWILRRAGGVLITAGLFFALGVALLLLPLDWIPRDWFMVAVGCDLIFFGLSIAVFDSFAQGETLRGDMTRSFLGSGAMALVFGGQIGFMMAISSGVTATMLVLMLTAIAASILIHTQARRFSHLLDTIAFPRESAMRQQRDVLNLSAETMARVDPSVNIKVVQAYNEVEFGRLTRRALSNYGNLPRLATSPLTRLPLIEARLKSRQAPDITL
jgi:hypothetical protein